MGLEIGVKFILNFVYFSVKLWENIQSDYSLTSELTQFILQDSFNFT